jgi:hypothetical protein
MEIAFIPGSASRGQGQFPVFATCPVAVLAHSLIPIGDSAPVSIGKAEPLVRRQTGVERSERTAALLDTLYSARSEVERRIWRDRASRGRAGQAFEFGEPGVADGTTADSLAADRRGPPRMTRPPRRSACR